MHVARGASFAFAALLACAALAAPATAQQLPTRTLTLCFEDIDVPPWRSLDHSGLNFELLNEAGRRAGIRLSYVAKPWQRCQSELRSNRVDGMFALSYVPERRAIGHYPPDAQSSGNYRLFSGGYDLVRRAGSAVDFDGRSITGLTMPVGSQPGYSIAADLRRSGYEVDDGSRDPRTLLRKLAAGRIDAAALGSNVLSALQVSQPALFIGLEKVSTPLVRKDYFLMLSNALVESDPVLANRLWQAIVDVRDSESYQAREQAATR